MNTKTSHLCRRVVKAFSALGIAKICVLTYVLFVMGSLFFAPWEGWGYAYSRPDMWGHQTWGIQRVTRYGPIFSPPANFYGADPKATEDYQQSQQAKNKPPRLKTEELTLLWGALGIAVIAVVWWNNDKKTQTKISEPAADKPKPIKDEPGKYNHSPMPDTPFSRAWDTAIDSSILAIKRDAKSVADGIKIGIAKLKEEFPRATDDHAAKFETAIRSVYDKKEPVPLAPQKEKKGTPSPSHGH